MPAITKLKLSPINNLSDARFAAAAGFDYMGFCFDPSSSDFLLPIKAKEILDWTTGSHAIGEFGDQSIDEIMELSELLKMDVVLLNNSCLPDELPQIGKPIIKVINLDHFGSVELANELCAYAPVVDAFQLNGVKPIAGREDEIKEACIQYKIIWNLPFQISNVKELINTNKPYAIQIQAGSEEKTGMKDFEEMNKLLDLLQTN